MDGATGQVLQVIRELDEQRKMSADADLPTDGRLEAYEDISIYLAILLGALLF